MKETTTFNYAYPETQKWTFNNVADYQRNVKSTVAQLYGTGNVVRDFITSGAINSLPTTNLLATQKAVAHAGASVETTVQDAAPAGEAQAPIIQVDNDIGQDREYQSVYFPSKHRVIESNFHPRMNLDSDSSHHHPTIKLHPFTPNHPPTSLSKQLTTPAPTLAAAKS